MKNTQAFIPGVILGVEESKKKEGTNYFLRVLQGFDSVSIFVPSNRLEEAQAITPGINAMVETAVTFHDKKEGGYCVFKGWKVAEPPKQEKAAK